MGTSASILDSLYDMSHLLSMSCFRALFSLARRAHFSLISVESSNKPRPFLKDIRDIDHKIHQKRICINLCNH